MQPINLIRVRNRCLAFGGGEMELVDSGNASASSAMPAIMELSTVVVLANFSERAQLIEGTRRARTVVAPPSTIW